MKFIVNCTKLLQLLYGLFSINDSKTKSSTTNLSFEYAEQQRFKIIQDNYIIAPPKSLLVIINALSRGSIKELLRRIALHMDRKVSTQIAVMRKTKLESYLIFFGLCCSSPGYIFNAIFGTSSYFISSLV